MKLILLISLVTLVSCQKTDDLEFDDIKPKLSTHFNYSLVHSEFRTFKNCKRFVFHIEGLAKEDLRMKTASKAFLSTSLELPLTLNEEGLKRIKEKYLLELRTQGVREHCLEVKEFECSKYSFRDPTEQDILELIQKLESEYAISLKQGEVVKNKIQLEKCPQFPYEVSYF